MGLGNLVCVVDISMGRMAKDWRIMFSNAMLVKMTITVDSPWELDAAR